MDRTMSYQRLGDYYYKSLNRGLRKIGIALLIVALVLSLIATYESYLNQNYQSKAEKMLQVRATIAQDTHIKSFHTEIVYQ